MGGAKKAIKKAGNSVKKTIKDPARIITKAPTSQLWDNTAGKLLGVTTGGILTAAGLKKAPQDMSPEELNQYQAKLGVDENGLTEVERRTGILAPKYEGMRDAQGNLKSQFAYDPGKSEAFSKLRTEAMADPMESAWTKMQLSKQELEQSGARDQAAKSQAQGLAQAQSNLMRQGGLGSGARTRMAMQGARDLARAQQDVARQGMQSRLGINESAINRQATALGNISATELEGQGKNLGTLQSDVAQKGQFDINRYKDQMAAYGAERGANAQVTAAKSSKKK
ncbi:MAG: hypothetical protein ACK58T_35525 [Phycisphaerae bacterium]|jgi:hypothetical protein